MLAICSGVTSDPPTAPMAFEKLPAEFVAADVPAAPPDVASENAPLTAVAVLRARVRGALLVVGVGGAQAAGRLPAGYI